MLARRRGDSSHNRENLTLGRAKKFTVLLKATNCSSEGKGRNFADGNVNGNACLATSMPSFSTDGTVSMRQQRRHYVRQKILQARPNSELQGKMDSHLQAVQRSIAYE